MGAMASQITGVSIVYSTVCSGADQTKHQSSGSLVFCGGFPVNSPHKGTVTRKMFPFDDVILEWAVAFWVGSWISLCVPTLLGTSRPFNPNFPKLQSPPDKAKCEALFVCPKSQSNYPSDTVVMYVLSSHIESSYITMIGSIRVWHLVMAILVSRFYTSTSRWQKMHNHTLHWNHYDAVIMSAMASQITSLTIVCSTVYSGVDQRKH